MAASNDHPNDVADLNPEMRATLEKIVERWNKTEGRIKEAELINNAVVLPAINELRYAGRRVVDVLEALLATENELPGEKRIERIRYCVTEAEHNCVKADHDVTDAILSYLHAHIDALVESFGLLRVIELFPEYRELASEMNDVKQKIIRSRERRLERRELYDSIATHNIPRVVALYQKMLSAERLIQESVVKELDSAYMAALRKERLKTGLAVAFGIIGVGFALFAALT